MHCQSLLTCYHFKLFEENIRKSLTDSTEVNGKMEPLLESLTVPTMDSINIGDENKENNDIISSDLKDVTSSNVEIRSKNNIFIAKDRLSEPVVAQQPSKRPSSKMFGRVSKFKHLKGEPLHKSKHFENLKNLSKTVPAECNMVHGKLIIFESIDHVYK